MADISETLRAGVEHHQAGRLPQAEQMYHRVLQIHPRHAGAIHLLGLIAFQRGRHDVAVQYLSEAIKIDAFHAPFSADLGEIFRTMGRAPEAIASYRKALALNPDVADAHNNLGTLLLGEGNPTEAAGSFREALRLSPRHGDAGANLALALLLQGRTDEGQAAYEQAIELRPSSAEAFGSLGTCLRVQGNWQGALNSYQQAARLRPDQAEARYQCGQALLALGQFAQGWTQFEFRLACPTWPHRNVSLPMWNGAPLAGHRVLVHYEGGLGDTLQFVRYIPLAIECGAEVVLDVQPELMPIMERAGFQLWASAGQSPTPCNLQAPLLSLPRIFNTTADTIPAPVSYLSAKHELVEHWKEKLSQLGDFKVGIAWQGDPHCALDRLRSIPLDHFQPLAEVPGIKLIRLQKASGLDQSPAVAGRFDVVELDNQFDDATLAVEHTAAIIANLDLVIACDTALAHLAGALGARVWVALSTAADWRWLLEREDSPWYRTMRLFRQSRPGDWDGVFARVAAELAAAAADRDR